MSPAIYPLQNPLVRRPSISVFLVIFVGLAIGLVSMFGENALSGPNARAAIAIFSSILWLGALGFVSCSPTKRPRFSSQTPTPAQEDDRQPVWQDQFPNSSNDDPPQVLVASPDVFLRSVLSFHLTRAGIHVEHASDRNEALARMKGRISAVVLDVMPGLDGLFSLRDIRRLSPSSKIIALRGRGRDQDDTFCRKFGAYDSLSKPVDPNDVVDVVERALSDVRIACLPQTAAA